MRRMECICEDWRESLPQLTAQGTFCAVNGGPEYNGPHYRFCPWCGLPLQPILYSDAKEDELMQGAGYYTLIRVMAFPSLGQTAWNDELDHETLIKSMRALRALAAFDPDNAPYAKWKADLVEAALIG
jgi:DNA-binding helix-hairpin-helix protein with protein kinase domain